MSTWDNLVEECEPLLDKIFTDPFGNRYRFFGLVHAEDDYYYGMSSVPGNVVRLLSCVGDLVKSHGYQLESTPSERKSWAAYSPMSARSGSF